MKKVLGGGGGRRAAVGRFGRITVDGRTSRLEGSMFARESSTSSSTDIIVGLAK